MPPYQSVKRLPRVAVFLDAPLTPAQEVALSAWLDSNPPAEIHHSCGKADEALLRIAGDLGIPRMIAHVSVDGRLVSRLALEASDVARPPLAYWDRLRAMLEADVVVAIPSLTLGASLSRARDAMHSLERAGRGYVLVGQDGEVEEVGGVDTSGR